MQERRYLLNIGQILEGSGRDNLFREAFDRIDRERRQKTRSLKNARAQAAGIGAGLLIQKALADYRSEWPAVLGTEHQTESGEDRRTGYLVGSRTEQGSGKLERQKWAKDPGAIEKPVWERFSVEELLSVLDPRVEEPCYRYGKNGKPYLADHAFLFNLSHSGDYVFCGVSKQEIGVDIQKIQGECRMRLAKRFFAVPECQALEACRDEEQRRRMFFHMWVRKEAYGKLTGRGIAGAVGKCLWRDASAGGEPSACSMGEGVWWENELIWEEYDAPDGYQTAVCRFRQETYAKQDSENA